MVVEYGLGWKDFFVAEFQKPYFDFFVANINREYKKNICYPVQKDIFRLFSLLEPQDIKIVIIGQDPYHGPEQANGLAFSVTKNVKNPPSLVNIFKELQSDLQINHQNNGDLTNWVKQGVFLYNTIGSVRAKEPLSHSEIGWKEFSQNLVCYLNKLKNKIIFVLWGNYAKNYAQFIDNKDNIILGAHPSPFSYYLFKNKKYFSKINSLLLKNEKNIIDWEM